MPRSNASSARHPRTAPDSDKVRQPVPTEMRYLDLRASWLGGSGHILDAQCNARLTSASMAARRAAWLTSPPITLAQGRGRRGAPRGSSSSTPSWRWRGPASERVRIFFREMELHRNSARSKESEGLG